MRETKVHPIKEIAAKLAGHPRLLIIGPLAIQDKLFYETLKKLRPSAILYIDGGLKHKKKLLNSARILEISVGDGDSTSGKFSPDFLLPKEKNYSDLAFALLCLQKTGMQMEEILFLGFSTTKATREPRLDHFLINMGEIEHFVRAKKVPATIDGHLHFYPAGQHSFKCRGTFSVLSFRKNKIKISGKARYQLRDWTPLRPLCSLGLSNIGAGVISLEAKEPVLIILPEKT